MVNSVMLWNKQEFGCIDQRPRGVFEPFTPSGFEPSTWRRTIAKSSGLAKSDVGRFRMQVVRPANDRFANRRLGKRRQLQDSLIETHAEQTDETFSFLVRRGPRQETLKKVFDESINRVSMNRCRGERIIVRQPSQLDAEQTARQDAWLDHIRISLPMIDRFLACPLPTERFHALE